MNEHLGRRMESEIGEQPSVLANADYYSGLAEALRGRDFDMILLAARGSSDNAAIYGRYLFEVALGIPVSLAAPSVLTRYGVRVRYPRCLAIGISQSGAAPDVAEALEAMREQGHFTVGVTNTEGSRLSTCADYAVHLGAGPETSVAATKTFSASLLAMYELARAIGANLPKFEAPTDAWLSAVRCASMDAAGHVVRCNPVFTLARGMGFSIALESALKLMECALIPCKPFSAADFEHGPKALAGPNSAAILYNAAMSDLTSQGCVAIAAPEPPVREEMKPMWDALFAQWLALHAARARALDPDAPRNLRKVTETR